MSDKPRDIFISYRRDGGFETAHYLYEHLTRDGYGVTFDLDTLRSGRFDEALLSRIDECTDFIVVLSKGCFDRTLDPSFPPENDWLRRELAYAIQTKKNVIPVLLSGFAFPPKLPRDIDSVRLMTGPTHSMEYIDAFYGKLKQFLKTPTPLRRKAMAGESGVSGSGAAPCAKCRRWRQLTDMFSCERCGKNYCLDHQDLETCLCQDCAEEVRKEGAKRATLKREGESTREVAAIGVGRRPENSAQFYKNGLDAFYGRGVPKSDGEAAKWWRKAAELGHVDAQFNLGWLCERGCGGGKNLEEAAKWYRKAAEQGNARAQATYAAMCMDGRGVPKNPAEAAKWYRKAAEQGNANAQCALGIMHAEGIAFPKSDVKAQAWYLKAAEQGNVNAQFCLGEIYEKARGVPRNYEEAAKWYSAAAEQGDASAQFALGLMSSDGRGVPKNAAKALEWYRKAAEQGHAGAQNNLGVMFHEGIVVPKDDTESVKWFRKAAEQGDDIAQCNLGGRYESGMGVAKSDEEAAKWYLKSAEQGNAIAQSHLGGMYESGRGVPKKAAEAAKWYRKAAEQGNVWAQRKLGWMLENGLGVPRDQPEAAEWYRKAAEQGDADAMCDLGWLLENGMGGWRWATMGYRFVLQDLQEAMKWYRKAAKLGSARACCSLGWLSKNGHGVEKNQEKADRWYGSMDTSRTLKETEIPPKFDREMTEAYAMAKTIENLGWQLKKEERRKEAKRLFEKAWTIYHNWWTLTDDAYFMRGLGDLGAPLFQLGSWRIWRIRLGCWGGALLLLGGIVWLVVWLVGR